MPAVLEHVAQKTKSEPQFEEVLSNEKDQRVQGLIDKGIAAKGSLFEVIGELYKEMVVGGRKRRVSGEYFGDIVVFLDTHSLSRCYEIGQAYLIRDWAVSQFGAGTLSFDPSKLATSCFEALRRLELQQNEQESEIDQDRLVVLEVAYLIAKKRCEAKGLERIRIIEADIHEAIDTEPQVSARPKKAKKSRTSSNTGSTRQLEELQNQLREQGQSLRAERELRLSAEAKAKELEILVEQRVRERLQEIAQQRDALQNENAALKAKLEALLHRDPVDPVPEIEKVSSLAPIFQELKKSAPLVAEATAQDTNQQNSPSILVETMDVWEEGIPELVAKKQSLGINVQVDGDELIIEGINMNLDMELLNGLTPLSADLTQILNYFHQQKGEIKVFRSHSHYYWQLPGKTVQIGGGKTLSGEICSVLGMTPAQIKAAIASNSTQVA